MGGDDGVRLSEPGEALERDGEGVDQIPSDREGEIRRQAQDIVDLEILLANITINDTDRSDTGHTAVKGKACLGR